MLCDRHGLIVLDTVLVHELKIPVNAYICHCSVENVPDLINQIAESFWKTLDGIQFFEIFFTLSRGPRKYLANPAECYGPEARISGNTGTTSVPKLYASP